MAYTKIEDIENWFSYHAPSQEQQLKYIALREKAKEYAKLILELCPDCADTTVALRSLREVSMQVNQAIACNS